MVEPHHLGWLLPAHAGRGGGPHGSQLGGLDGALYGVSALWRPQALISDSGGAFTSNEFEAVCTRLQIDHKPMESTKGESYLNWMETHFNVQRRLYDYQFSLSTTPLEFEQDRKSTRLNSSH